MQVSNPCRPPSREDWPLPKSEELNHSARLVAAITAEIDAAGAIPFRRYMEMALYQPGLGYYVSGARKFGRQGDFITAPEITPLFARCLARACVQVLGEVTDGDILEFGAGSGIMAAELLREMEALQCLPSQYLILDVSAELRLRQREMLSTTVPHLVKRVTWLDSWPKAFQGIVLANEVLDAMPVQRFCLGASGVSEIFTTWRAGCFSETARPAPEDLAQCVDDIQRAVGYPLAPDYLSEVNLLLLPWFRSLAESLGRGAVVIIDYGYPRREYYRLERCLGTLICHYRHRAHTNPYLYPGLQDITAFVDFTAVAEAGTRAGLELEGFTTQAHFLLENGLDELVLCAMKDAPLVRQLQVSQQAKTLVFPGELGEKFRVIGFSKGLRQPLPGFQSNDQSNRL